MVGERFVVRAVCTSGPDREPVKVPRDEVAVGEHGFEGDRHAGTTVVMGHGRHKGQTRPNLRQWSAVALEEVEEACSSLGIPVLPPGALGENLLLEGLTGLTRLKPGTQLHFQTGVVLEVVEENLPCVGPAQFWAERLERPELAQTFVKTFMHRRGLVGVVRRPGPLRPGVEGTVHPPAQGKQARGSRSWPGGR